MVVTGSNGWLGRAMINTFLGNESINFSEKLVLPFNRSNVILDLDNFVKIPTIPYNNFSIQGQKYDYFVPSAFLTQDFSNAMSMTNYRETNLKLIGEACDFVSNSEIGTLINFSSGIVSQMSDKQREIRSYVIYKELKEIQEQIFEEVCAKTGTTFINCRVFSVTGRFCPRPEKYGFFNLINQVRSKSVYIETSSSVFRKYMDVEELMCLLLKVSNLKKSVNLESAGELIEYEDLANLICEILEVECEIRRSKDPSPIDSYFSTSSTLEVLASRLKFKLSDLKKQIKTSYLELLNRG